MALAEGTRLDRYSIRELLGSGGMGEVYRAVDENLERDVAIKVLRRELSFDPERIRRFMREAKAVARLRHPNVLTVFDIGNHGGVPYVVSELLEGETLRQRLSRGPLALDQATEIGLEMGRALQAAHDHGIVHRDLKPENVFLPKTGGAKLLDFGIAKLLPGPYGNNPKTDATVSLETEPGVVIGTVGYMAPEQVVGEGVDNRADLFALGAILFEMVEGRRAFAGETPVERLAAILKESPPPIVPNDTTPSMAAFRSVVGRCLEKDVALRYQRADELIEALARVERQARVEREAHAADRVETRVDRGAQPRAAVDRRSTLLWIGGSTALGALGLTIGRFARRSGEAEPTPPQPTTADQTATPEANARSPRFTRLSYQAGGITSARFTSDGHNVVFGAAFGNDALRVHTVRTETPATLALDISGDVLAVSKAGEMAVSLGRRLVPWPGEGTLARSPLLGGAPRALLEGVQDADFEASGDELIITRRIAGKMRVERPSGTVVFETDGWLSHIRLDPNGERLAFFLHPLWNDTQGKVAVLERDRTLRVLSETFMDLNGLAWTAGSSEIWFSGAAPRGPFEIAAVTLDGKRRRVFQGPGRVVLHDISSDGRALVTVDDWRGVSVASQPGAADRDLSVLDNSIVTDLTADGSRVLLSEQSAGGRPGYDIYIRPTSGGPATLLGEGLAMSISPTGARVAAVVIGTESAIDIIPTGPGTKRRLTRPGFNFQNAFFLGSDERLLVLATEASSERRLYTMNTESQEAPVPISPPGPWLEAWPRSDGEGALTRKPNGEIWHFAGRSGAEGKLVATLPAGHSLVRPITATSAFVLRRGTRPGEVLRLDLATGKLSHHLTLAPRDLTGFVEASTFVGAERPERFAYTYFRLLSTLFILEGL